jgi:hypothetical protein
MPAHTLLKNQRAPRGLNEQLGVISILAASVTVVPVREGGKRYFTMICTL